MGYFDVWAIGATSVLLVQVKSGNAKPSKAERKQMMDMPVPPVVRKEIWTYKKFARHPIIEKLN